MADLDVQKFNIEQQSALPDTKIFFVGFNKCATSAIHHLMAEAGIRSIHWGTEDDIIAQGIETRLTDEGDLRKYLCRWTAYSDLTFASDDASIEGNRHFRLFHAMFPQSFFVLQCRDTDAWLRSRAQHKNGSYLRRMMNFYNTDADSVRLLWKAEYERHSADVCAYFDGYDRFLRFRVDADPISKLIDFIAPVFRLSESDWTLKNVTRHPSSGGASR